MCQSTYTYDYNQLIHQLNQFCGRIDSPEFERAWKYTKLMVGSHGEAIRKLTGTKTDCQALAWSHFESTFDDEEHDALLALTGIVIHLVNSVPFGQTKAFHQAIEVGFSMARGFSKQEAMEQLAMCHIQNATANTERIKFVNESSTTLHIIAGGKR